MAGIELSVLSRQCMNDYFENADQLAERFKNVAVSPVALKEHSTYIIPHGNVKNEMKKRNSGNIILFTGDKAGDLGEFDRNEMVLSPSDIYILFFQYMIW